MLSTERAIELIRQQLVKDLEHLAFDDPEMYRWWNITTNVIREVFGTRHPNVLEFNSTSPSQFPAQFQRDHAQNIRTRKALLGAFIEQLELLRPANPNGAVPIPVQIATTSEPSILESVLGDRSEAPEGQPRRRGRKRSFSTQQLEQARQMKAAGKRNRDIAKILYGPQPTDAQRRSVPTTLKHHFGSSSKIEETAERTVE